MGQDAYLSISDIQGAPRPLDLRVVGTQQLHVVKQAVILFFVGQIFGLAINPVVHLERAHFSEHGHALILVLFLCRQGVYADSRSHICERRLVDRATDVR